VRTIANGRLHWCLALLPASLVLAGCAATNPALHAEDRAAEAKLASGQVSQTTQKRQEIIAACTDLVMDYAVFRDRVDVEGYAGLFSVDGSLTLRGKTISGQEAIRARISEALNGPRTRHLMSTIRITPLDDNHAIGVSYATIYSAPRPELSSTPALVQSFTAVGDYVDEFVRTDTGWRISRRTLEIQFLYGEK